MNAETFCLLSEHVHIFVDNRLFGRSGDRIKNTMLNADVSRFIDLYRHERQGLLRYRNFGKESLNELNEKLQEYGLPSLDGTYRTVQEFDRLCASPQELSNLIGQSRFFAKDKYLLRLVLGKALASLGLHNDPETIRKVLQIAWV